MTDEIGSAQRGPKVPQARKKTRRGPSIVWLIPLIALAIGGWLAYTTIIDRGPTITITFKTAEGLEAGKTKIKFKDVQIGLVQSVEISDDISHIVVVAEMSDKTAKTYLTDKTSFWIVRPRIGASGVSGLSTLLSGNFIEIDPSSEGKPVKEFVGLEEPPPISSDVPGTKFVLHADHLGSIGRGSPVYFRGIEVGQVLGHHLADDNASVEIDIFVETPHHTLVHDDTSFWNASGINLSLSATGFEVSTESLLSIMAGGVAFETLPSAGSSEVAAAGTAFPLHDSRSDAEESEITVRSPYLVYFDGSVRGLSVGAPVEFRGIRIGSVADVHLVVDEKDETLIIPVLIQIEPQRITIENPLDDQSDEYYGMANLVARGLRAQLQLGNLLTGELYIALDFHPDAEPAILNMDGRFPELPTIPTDLEAIAKSINNVLKGIAALPLAELVGDMSDTAKSLKALVSSDEITGMIAALSRSAATFDDVMASVDKDIGPLLSDLRGTASAAEDAMIAARSTMTSTEQMVGEKSTMRYDLNKLITELTAAARSIRVFADYLERHPDSLLRGKAGSSR